MHIMSKQLGRFHQTERFHQTDAGHSIVRDDGNATKTKIATFSGQHFIAEREGDELCVYSVGDQDGLPGANVLGNDTGDGSNRPTTIADLNKLNAQRRGEKVA